MRLAFLLFLVSCANAAPRVVVEPSVPKATRDLHTTLLPGCRIIGVGERRPEPDTPAFAFGVFAAAENAPTPTFLIAHPRHAHVTWLQFPLRPGGRARLAIGGQAHVRFEGFADLYGRTFTALRDMPSVTGHLWARAGARLFVMNVTESGELFGQVRTPFSTPREVVVQGTCADVAYVPDDGERPPHAPVVAADLPAKLALFTSPDAGTPFTTVSFFEAAPFEVRERRADRIRIVGEAGHVGVDAWASALPGERPKRDHVFVDDGQTLDALENVHPADIPHDTQIFGDDPPEPIAGATLEGGARVLVGSQRVRVGGDVVVPFEFADGLIAAPPGTHLWVSEAAVRQGI